MSRLAALALLLLGLPTCGQGTGPQLLPPYDGPLEAGREAWTGYQPGSVDIGDLVGPSGIPGMIPGVHAYQVVLAPGIDWNSADALAKATLRNGIPGHLAAIGSPEENAAVEALRIALTTGEVWLGGFQPAGSAEPGGGWTWVNGEGNAVASLGQLKADDVSTIVLVTHGWHMRRAQRAFQEAAQQRGMSVQIVAAPMGLAAAEVRPVLRWLPTQEGFTQVRMVLREALGFWLGA